MGEDVLGEDTCSVWCMVKFFARYRTHPLQQSLNLNRDRFKSLCSFGEAHNDIRSNNAPSRR